MPYFWSSVALATALRATILEATALENTPVRESFTAKKTETVEPNGELIQGQTSTTESKIKTLTEAEIKTITSTTAKIGIKTSTRTPQSDLGILLIDMQDDFLQEIDEDEKAREIPRMQEVLNYAGKRQVPIVVLEYRGHGETIEALKREIISLPTDIRYIVKNGDDGFYQTPLAEHLEQLGVKDLILMGVNATGCVKTTAYGALKNGFGIITSRDVIAQPSSWVDDQKYEGAEGTVWFQKKGRLANDYRNLLRIIAESSRSKRRLNTN